MKRTLMALAAVTVPGTAALARTVSAKPLPLGSKHTFRQRPDALDVAVVQVIDPVRGRGLKPRPGSRLVAVRVRVRNVGARALYAGTSTGCHALASARLVDAGGRAHASRDGVLPNLAAYFALGGDPYVETRSLQPGETATGFYTFALPRKMKGSFFSVAPCARKPPARWRLR